MSRRTVKGILLTSIMICTFMSCEVGLGPAVDTQPPEVEILTPEVDRVIKGKVTVSGKWSDDGTIDDIYVTLKRTDGNVINSEGKKEKEIKGSWVISEEKKEEGTWKAEIDPKGEDGLIDGTYQITVTAKDKGKHKTTQSTTFTVDNTPPVLILTKPNSVPGDGKTVSAYGQRLFLEGSIADSTKDTWIQISFYSDESCSESTLLTTVETGLIAPTDVNSNNAKLASFGEQITDAYTKAYRTIYGRDGKNDGAARVYSTIRVYDTAMSGSTEEEAEKGVNGQIKGNSTEKFFISRDLAENVTKSQAAGGYGLAPIDIYNILNGTYVLKNGSREAEAKTIKALLEGEDGLSREKTVFTVNPANSPYFTVSGLNPLTKDADFDTAEGGYWIINGSQSLEISVFMGSDSIELVDDEDFYAYLVEYGKENDADAEKIKLKSKADENENGEAEYKEGGKQAHRTTTGAYVFTVPMNKAIQDMEYGKNYVILVSGKDSEGNEVVPGDGGYGFHFTSSSTRPVMKITEPEDNTVFLKKGETLVLKGTVKTEQGLADVIVWNGDEKVESDIALLTRNEGEVNAFEGSVDTKAFVENENKSGTYSLTVRGSLGGEKENSAEYQMSVWYDVENPGISNLKVVQDGRDAYTDGERYYINNKNSVLSVSGVATDNAGVQDVTLVVEGSGDGEKLSPEMEGSVSQWNFGGLDMKSWSGNGAKAIVKVTDRAGNSTEKEINIVFDVTAPQAVHKIDDTDKDLSFRIGDYANDKGEKDVGGKYSEGTYGSALTIQIRGEFPDENGGSGINKYYYKVFNNQEVKIDSSKTGSKAYAQGTGADAGKIFFSSKEALVRYVIEEKTGEFTPLSEAEVKNVEYNVTPGGSPATAENTRAKFGGEAVNGYNLTSKGKVQFRTAVRSNYKTTIKGFSEGRNYLVLAAQDNAGNTGLDCAEVEGEVYPCYSLNVDITAPNIPSKQEGTVYTNVIKKLDQGEPNPDVKVEITGTVSDKSGAENGSSGIKGMVFTSDQNSAKVELGVSDLTDAATAEDGTLKTWKVDVRPLLSKNGSAIISARVTDNAGYETSVPVANINVDITKPTVKITSPASEAKVSKTFTISGTAGDGNGAGIDETKPMVLYYTLTDPGTVSYPDVTDQSQGWTAYTVNPVLDGQDWTCSFDAQSFTQEETNRVIYITVCATDSAGSGNTGFSAVRKFTVDRKKPVFNDSESGIQGKKGQSQINGQWFNATILRLSGAFTDEGGSGVTVVSYSINGEEAPDIQTTDGTYGVNVQDFIQGENTVQLSAKDAAGNRSTQITYTFNVDSIAPKITSVSADATTQGSDVELTINITDDHPVAPEVKVKRVETGDTYPYTAEAEQSGAWKVTIPFGTTLTDDGSYEVEITAKDMAGNKSSVFSKEIIRDEVKPVIAVTKPEDSSGGFQNSASYQFEGTVTEANEIKQATVTLYKMEDGNPVAAKAAETIVPVPDTQHPGTWTWVYPAYELEGVYFVKINVKDIAGNDADEVSSPTVSLDKEPPTVTLEFTGLNDKDGNSITDEVSMSSSGTQYYANGSYTIKVKVDDENFDYNYNSHSLVTVSGKDNGGSDIPVALPDAVSGGPVLKEFTFHPAAYADGIYTYTIKVKDKANNSSGGFIVKVWRDTTGPEVTIKMPSSPTGSVLDEDKYSFRIYASDNSGVGVANLSYAFSNNGTKEDGSLPDGLTWTTVSMSDGDKIIEKDLVNAETPNPTANQLKEGQWYLYAKAIDSSGNETENFTVAEFIVDKNDPDLNVEDLTATQVNPLFEEIQGGKYTISGTANDANGLDADAAVTIYADGTKIKEIKGNEIGSDHKWSYNIQNGTGPLKKDQAVVIKVTAKDKAGKTTSKSYTLHYDTKAPELKITSPASGEAVEEAEKTIGGTVSDGGYGIEKLEYTLYRKNDSGTTEEITSGTTQGSDPDAKITGEQWSILKNNGKITLGTQEGELRLDVVATENGKTITQSGSQVVTGRRTTSKNVTFYYDKEKPHLTEKKVDTRGITTKDAFTFEGKVWDSNEVKNIKISCEIAGTAKTWISGTSGSNITIDTATTKSTTEPSANNWSASFVTGETSSEEANYIPDGTHVFTVIAIDKANKETQFTRTVVVDTQSPVINSVSVDKSEGKGKTIDSKFWHTSTSIQIEAEATDNGDSGISKVEYSISSDANGTPLSFIDNKYKGTVNLSGNGEKKFYVKATDVANNVSSLEEVTVYIDTGAPDLSVKFMKQENGELTTVPANGLYINKNKKIVLYGNYSDTLSGSDGLKFSLDGTDITDDVTVKYSTENAITDAASVPSDDDVFKDYDDITVKTSIKSWKAEYTTQENKSGKFAAEGKDRIGHTTGELKLFDITVDDESPEVSNIKLIEFKVTKDENNQDVTTEQEAFYKNGKYYIKNDSILKISGVATDNIGVEDVALVITDKDNSASTANGTFGGSKGQWNFSNIDIKQWTGSGADAKITVSDKTGNKKEQTIQILFDKAAPGTPVLNIQNETFAESKWYKETTLNVSGSYTDSLSGVTTVYCQKGSETKTLSTTDGTFSTNIQGFESGNNTIKLWAEDAVGNKSGELIYTIKVDLTAPTFEAVTAGDFSKTTVTNGRRSEEFYFYVIENGSGITASSFTVTIGENEIELNQEDKSSISLGTADSNGKRLVTLTIVEEDITGNDGYKTVLVTAKDEAQNVSLPQSIGMLNKDSTPPQISFVSPDENTRVNKTITVKGEASDPNDIESLTLTAVCGTNTNTKTKTYSFEKDAAGNTISFANGSWSVSIDTTQLDSSFPENEGNNVVLSLKAKDSAGNETQTALKRTLKINQNDDRPVITIGSGIDFTNKNGTTEIWAKGSSTIYGSVEDDDGIAAGGFKIYYKKGTSAEKPATTSYSGGSWNVKLLDSDGSYSLRFEVTDKGGTTFTSISAASSDADILSTPVIKDSEDGTGHKFGDTKENGNTIIPLCLDTTPPTLMIEAISLDKTNWKEDLNTSDINLGGDYDTFYVKVKASDSSGLASTSAITASFSGTMKDGEDVYTLDCPSDAFTVENIKDSENKPTDEFIIKVTNFKNAYKDAEKTLGKDFSGTLTLTVTAKDKADMETQKSISRTVDNAKPVIKISAPSSVSSTAVVSGTVEGEVVNPKVYFAVTKAEADSCPVENSDKWQQERFASLAYNIYFDGSSSTTTTHTDLFKQYLVTTGITTSQALDSNQFKDPTDVYVWIKAVDVCNNVAYEHATVNVDPQGNRPSVTVSYPDEDSSLGGTIRIMGTANDNIEAKYVWIKLDADGDGDWDMDDYNRLKTKNPGYTFGHIKSNKTLAEANMTASATNIGEIAVMVSVSGGSWNLSVNAAGELIPDSADPDHPVTENDVTMWVCATDDDNNNGSTILESVAVTRLFHVDSDTPYFVQDTLRLTKADGSEQSYKEGMSIRGVWWLEGTVKDDGSGIKKITIKEEGSNSDITKIENASQNEPQEITAENEVYQFRKDIETDPDDLTKQKVQYKFKIKVGAASGTGQKSFRITAYEATTENLSTYKDFTVKYDNEPPTYAEYTLTNNAVKNSEGYYKLGSKAYEKRLGDTGVERIAVYFTRTLNETTYIFDPMYKRTAAASKLTTVASGEGIIKDTTDNLYWGSAAASSIASDKVTLSTDPASYVHVGGLAKVKGVVYTIKSISGKEIHLSDDTGIADASNETVYFAVANVVDNSLPEAKDTTNDQPNSAYNSETGYGYGYCDKFVYDDGDKIMEYLLKNDSTTWSWELYVNSKNIPDGDVDIHYVIFDKAGNSAHNSIQASVENNKPRLVSVALGIDVNQDGDTNDAGELTYYYPDGKEDVAEKPAAYSKAKDTINISGITVKGKMTVKPEIVGGNKELYYRYKTKKSGDDFTEVDEKLMVGNNDYDDTDFTDTNDYVQNNALTVQSAQIEHDISWFSANSNGNTNDYSICYEIWDSTEGKTYFLNSNKVTINITDIDLKVFDETDPSVSIKPLYWESLTHNSVYTSKTAADVKSVADLEGHIELKNELPADFKNTVKNENDEDVPVTGEYDRDDKVSGIIRLEGEASDNIVLKDLFLSIDGMEGISSYTKVASYNKSQGKWMKAGNTTDEFVTVGSLSGENATGYEFRILTDTNTFDAEDGHKVNWEILWDTSKISGVAGTDKKIKLKATDDASHAGQPADKSKETDLQVDVVPYVISLTTSLSSANENNPSVYDRTALGHYPVYKTHGIYTSGTNIGKNSGYKYEEIEIKGFNLYDTTTVNNVPKGGKIVFEKHEASTGTELALGETTAAAYTNTAFLTPVTGKVNTYKFNLPNGAKSGNAHIAVGTVVSLNNKNNNMAHGADSAGSETELASGNTGNNSEFLNYYNRLPNGVNNNRLTDDLVIDVWDFNSAAATPKNNAALDIVMKINPASSLIGFAFCNGYKNWSMPTGSYSYQNWAQSKDLIQCTGFTYSSRGKSFGTCAGGESEGQRSDAYVFLTSQWGTIDKTGGNNDKSLRIEATGQYNDTTKITDINKERFKSASIATIPGEDGDDTDTLPDENIYLAFYDDINGEIRFRAGTLPSGSTNKTVGLSTTDGKNSFGNFVDRLTNNGWGVTSGNYDYTAQDCQIVADLTGTDTLGVAGEYLSIGVLSNNVVVMVWYDPKGNNLMCSYNTNPLALTTGKNKTNWEDAKVIMRGAGKYCNLVVDSEDGVHVAAYDSSNGDLKYAYIGTTETDEETPIIVPDYENPKVCKVDTYQAVGKDLTIDVAKENGYQIPHIGYYGNTPKLPRYAYLSNPSAFYDNGTYGAISDQYTGVWECGIVPSPSKITTHSKRRINVGVWKNNAGEKTSSIKGTDEIAKPGADNGKCYGNGTDNAVLGYGVRYSSTQDFVETAQMR